MQTKGSANFIYLLIGLLVILVGGPLVSEFRAQNIPLVWQIAFSVTLIIGLWSLMESRLWFRVGIALVISDLTLTAVYLSTNSMIAEVLRTVIEIAFCALSLVIALDHVLFGRRMDLNRIVGAICVYLLLGLLFSLTNGLVYRFVPGAFNGIEATEVSTTGFTLLYYSFVTMTTLGYGDISPESPIARVLAYLSAIAGQFYIAVLVAMIVTQYMHQQNDQKNDD
jgi:voltage-gated potassium channel